MKLVSLQLLSALFVAEHLGLGALPGSKIRSLWPGGYSQALSRLVKSGLVKKESQSRDKGDPSRLGGRSEAEGSLSITYQGKNKLLARFPLLSFLEESLFVGEENLWKDFNLTLVVFNIPESQRKLRDSLRYRLKTLGFGQINRSLYLSPHLSVKETKEIVPEFSIFNFQFSILVLAVPFTSFQEINLASFWDLSVCSEDYERALAVWEMRKSAPDFLHRFLTGLLADPLLPPSLLPKDWVGNQALEIARTILAE